MLCAEKVLYINSHVKCRIYIKHHCSQRMNPADTDDHVTFAVAPPTGQSFHLSCEISQHVRDELAPNFVQTFIVPKGGILRTLVIP